MCTPLLLLGTRADPADDAAQGGEPCRRPDQGSLLLPTAKRGVQDGRRSGFPQQQRGGSAEVEEARTSPRSLPHNRQASVLVAQVCFSRPSHPVRTWPANPGPGAVCLFAPTLSLTSEHSLSRRRSAAGNVQTITVCFRHWLIVFLLWGRQFLALSLARLEAIEEGNSYLQLVIHTGPGLLQSGSEPCVGKSRVT